MDNIIEKTWSLHTQHSYFPRDAIHIAALLFFRVARSERGQLELYRNKGMEKKQDME